jgi:hypothetical protein
VSKIQINDLNNLNTEQLAILTELEAEDIRGGYNAIPLNEGGGGGSVPTLQPVLCPQKRHYTNIL